jgi:hypothetical protein
MNGSIHKARVGLLALAVSGALGFGASAALADVAPVCPRLAIGRCNSLAQCQDQCAQAGGNVANASCRDGCCYCPIAFR